MRRVLAALVIAATASVAADESQTPVFKTGVTLVTVDVTVLDKDGKPVPGLTADDFQIKLNGKVQPVRTLSYVEVAEKAAPLAAREIAPEVTGRRVVSNDAPKGEQKIFVIAVDDLSFPLEGGKRTLKAARAFVDAQSSDVLVGLTTTSGATVVNPTFDHAAVTQALGRVVGSFIDPRRPLTVNGPTIGIAEAIDIVDNNDNTALQIALKRECQEDAATSIDGLYASALKSLQSKCANDAAMAARYTAAQTRGNTEHQVASITDALTAMKNAPGLKQMVLLSEGIGSTRNVALVMAPISRAAAEAGVQMSVIMEDEDELDLSDPGHAASEAVGQVMVDTGLSNRRRADKMMFRTSLQTLADVSGGTFELVIGQGDKAFERAAVAGSAVYRIGVEPPGDVPASKAFSVSASVKRSGLAVHANREAVLPGPAPKPTAADQVAVAIKEGQPFFSVPIRLAVAMRRAASSQVELGIGMEVPASVKGPLTMTFGLVDQAGALKQGSRTLPVPPANANYRVTFPMPVAPGRYSLRFAVTDADGAVGSLETAIDAKLAPMGALNASDVLTWWTDTAGKAQFLALDEVPAGVAFLGSGIELYPPPGANFPDDVKVKMSLVPAGASAAVVEKEVSPLLGDNMLRAEAMLPLTNVPVGTYVLKASVTVGGQLVGEASALVRKR